MFHFVTLTFQISQTIVSQDVSLFTGTIRSNLDPFGEHTDAECWDALHRCHLTKRKDDPESRNIASLDMMISPTGSLSSGERQLVALARAILRRSQVIIMDEATSQIDTLLDDKVIVTSPKRRVVDFENCRSRRQLGKNFQAPWSSQLHIVSRLSLIMTVSLFSVTVKSYNLANL